MDKKEESGFMKVRDIVMGALLTALALMIPLMFKGWLQVYVPPFSATLASHVPSMLAIFISPAVAALVGIGSTIGFAITLGPVIAARAAIHIIFGVVGAYMYRAGMRPWVILLAVLPIHAVGEALVVIPFGFDLYKAGVVIGLGSVLHHLADAFITMAVFSALRSLGIRLSEVQARKAA